MSQLKDSGIESKPDRDVSVDIIQVGSWTHSLLPIDAIRYESARILKHHIAEDEDDESATDEACALRLLSEILASRTKNEKTYAIFLCSNRAEAVLKHAWKIERESFDCEKSTGILTSTTYGVIFVDESSRWRTVLAVLSGLSQIPLAVVVSNWRDSKDFRGQIICQISTSPSLSGVVNDFSHGLNSIICSSMPSHQAYLNHIYSALLNPSPELLALSTLLFSGLFILQIHLIANDKRRKNFLIIGIMVGFTLNTLTHSSGQKIALLMLATSVSMMLSTVVHALWRRFFLLPATSLDIILQEWVHDATRHGIGSSGVRFLYLA